MSINLFADDQCMSSKWGDTDEIGMPTSECKFSAKASRLIKNERHTVSITIDSSTPAYPPRSLSLQVVQPTQQFGKLAFPNATYNDDIFQGWFGIGSQIDGLGHIGDSNAEFYNCFDGKEISHINGLTKLGIEKIPPIVARGALKYCKSI